MGLEPSTNIPTNVKKETFTFPQYATIALKWVSFHFMVPGHLHSRSVAHRKTNLNSTDVTHVGLGYPMLKDWHSVSLYMRSECYIIFLILKLITVISGKKRMSFSARSQFIKCIYPANNHYHIFFCLHSST